MHAKLTFAILLVVGGVTPQTIGAAGQASATGVALARMVNTAQAHHRNGYVPLQELVNDSAFARVAGQIVIDGDEIVVGLHRVVLTVNEDRRRYQVSVVSSESCSPAWFSSERGLIYTGKALGC